MIPRLCENNTETEQPFAMQILDKKAGLYSFKTCRERIGRNRFGVVYSI